MPRSPRTGAKPNPWTYPCEWVSHSNQQAHLLKLRFAVVFWNHVTTMDVQDTRSLACPDPKNSRGSLGYHADSSNTLGPAARSERKVKRLRRPSLAISASTLLQGGANGRASCFK